MNETVLFNFPKCKVCGSEELVSHVAHAKDEVPGVVVSLSVTNVALENPHHKVLTVPMLHVFRDICGGCGTERVTVVVRSDQPISGAEKRQPNRN